MNEKELIIRAKKGDKKAKEILIQNNIFFIYKLIFTEYKDFPHLYEDLVSEGIVGLLQAIEEYDLDKYGDNKFFTYVSQYVRQKLEKFVKREHNIINIPIESLQEGVDF